MVDLTGEEGIIAASPRYIHGYESLVVNKIPAYTDTNVVNLTSLYVDDIIVYFGTTKVAIAAQTISGISGSIGNNFYIYASNSGSLSVSTTKSADTTSSRLIGGFHYGRVRKSTTATDVATGIVPNSVWTLLWRPSCPNPDAMVYMSNKLWGDIYLTRIKTNASSGIGGAVYDSSAYGVNPGTGTEGFNQHTFVEALSKVGKRLATGQEFCIGAEGAPQGQNNNTYAWSASSNTARCTCGYVQYSISSLNICDLVGNVWKWASDIFFRNGGSATWESNGIGSSYGGVGALFCGGAWGHSTYCGPRSFYVCDYPWHVHSQLGAWAVSYSK